MEITGKSSYPNYIKSDCSSYVSKLKMFKPIPPMKTNEVPVNGNAEGIGSTSILLDYSNALPLSPMNSKEYMYIHGKDYWHKVIVINAASYDREVVLKHIMDCVFPADLIPVMCRDDGTNLVFLIRRCPQSIDRLRKMRMMVDTPHGKLELKIVLGFAHCKDIPLNMQKCLIDVIKKRYDPIKRYLDITNFHKDPELVDIFYCPLSQTRILNCVMNVIVNLQLAMKTINMANNNISFVRNMGSSWQFKQLYCLDLRQNSIQITSELVILRQTQLRELFLDINPVCEKYSSERDYIRDVQNAIPGLQKLDGVALPAPGFPRFVQNFILPEDDIPLADQFIRHYFTVYDTEYRRKLEGLYHKEALFSLSATYLPAQSSSNTARLTEYTMESRNLLKLSDYSKNLKLLHQRPKAIMEILCRLPRTEHDPYSFTVDAVRCMSGVVITVTGIFREPTMIKTPLIRSFHRVFVLVNVAPRSFQIVNETVHISNATTKEVDAAFKITKPAIAPKLLLACKSGNLSETEKDQLANTMSKLTTMNRKWASKCLDETKWDIKEALIVFTELYKMDKIPQEAFSKN